MLLLQYMRYLGIDYGAKRVGIAISDESGKIAFPHAILENKIGLENLVKKIGEIISEKKVGKIILGESLNYKREANPIMAEITKLKTRLEEALELPVILEPEWLTSVQAARSAEKGERIDDSAAALILQTFLDRL